VSHVAPHVSRLTPYARQAIGFQVEGDGPIYRMRGRT
jgi:hypothetical protein